MTIFIKNNGSWLSVTQPFVKTAGVWRTVINQSVLVSGTWRSIFPIKGIPSGWGTNTLNQLGTNDSTQRPTPVQIFGGTIGWRQISTGYAHTAAIKTDGTLWTWGRNYNGQLGNNTTSPRPTPVTTFAGGTNWKQVSCGTLHTAAIKTDGTLWTWGSNSSGQLGINLGSLNRLTPVTTFAGGTNWNTLGCGGYNSAAIKTDGTLWVWGLNQFWGGLGINNTSVTSVSTPITTFAGGTNWRQVSAGGYMMAAIKTDGTLWNWGSNYLQKLGNNASGNSPTPITTFAGGTNWSQVKCSQWRGNHVVAVKTDGTLWAWGDGRNGQLGNNVAAIRSTPVTTFAGGTNWRIPSAAVNFSAGVKSDGTIWTWGQNSNNELGTNDTTQRNSPVPVFGGSLGWVDVSCGGGSAGLTLGYCIGLK